MRALPAIVCVWLLAGCKLVSPLDDVAAGGSTANGGSGNNNGGNTNGGSSNPPPDNCDQVELLNDGNFDQLSGVWQEASSNGFTLIRDSSELPGVIPESGDYAAWLGGVALEESGLLQVVTVPEGTVQLTASGYYGLVTTDVGDGDFGYVALADGEANVLGSFAEWYPEDAVQPWNGFTATLDAASLAGTDVLFVIGSSTDDFDDSNFFFDSMSLTATVCE